MRSLLLISFCICITFFKAQKRVVDSLENILHNVTEDTLRLHYMAYLSNVCELNQIQNYVIKGTTIADDLLTQQLKPQMIKNVKGYKAMLLSNYGYFYDTQGNTATAIDLYQKSLDIFMELGEVRQISYILSNLAFIYDSNGDIEKAVNTYNRALNVMIKLNDKQAIASTIHNLGTLYFKQNDLERAEQMYMRSLTIYKEGMGTERTGFVSLLTSLTNLYSKQNKLKEAQLYCNQALEYNGQVDNEFVKASAYVAAGSLFIKAKTYDKAKVYLDSAVKLGRRYGLPVQQRDAEEYFHELYLQTNDHKLSLQHYKEYIKYRDTIINDKIRKESVKRQMREGFERRERELKEEQERERIIADDKQRSQQLIIYGVCAGLLLVVVFSLFIFKSLQENKKQRTIVELKNHIIQEKQNEIIDSINYAKRIQYTLLAHDQFLDEHIPNHFVYFAPKDIVSGDFYWASEHQHKFYLAVCDSTGHGVPGAFMSLLNIGFLSEAINEKNITQPDKVLNYVRERLIDTISRDGQKDGFDGIVLCIDKKSGKITYAAANNAPVLVSNGVMQELQADRMPVGKGERGNDFTLFEAELKKGDTLYLYTDGYADQFGGPRGKKFKYKQLNDLLLANSYLSLEEQKQHLQTKFTLWKGDLEQVDDVCVIGIKI